MWCSIVSIPDLFLPLWWVFYLCCGVHVVVGVNSSFTILLRKREMIDLYCCLVAVSVLSQQIYDVETTSNQRRCDVNTSHRR